MAQWAVGRVWAFMKRTMGYHGNIVVPTGDLTSAAGTTFISASSGDQAGSMSPILHGEEPVGL